MLGLRFFIEFGLFIRKYNFKFYCVSKLFYFWKLRVLVYNVGEVNWIKDLNVYCRIISLNIFYR